MYLRFKNDRHKAGSKAEKASKNVDEPKEKSVKEERYNFETLSTRMDNFENSVLQVTKGKRTHLFWVSSLK